jgi:hypothetical protein
VKARLGESLGLKSAVQLAEDGGVVPAYVEDLEPLQVQVAVEGLGKHFMGSYPGVEEPGAEGDGMEEIKVRATC